MRTASDIPMASLIAPPIDRAASAGGTWSGRRCPGTAQIASTTWAWVGMSASAAL